MYQLGKRTRRPKGPKVFLQTAIVFAIALVIVVLILQKDLSTSTDPKTSVPIVTEVKTDEGEKLTINEPLFTFQLPGDWEQTNRVQTKYSNFYEWHSTRKGGDDRRLLLHINTLPQSYKIVKLLPLRPNGDTVLLGSLSDDCINFGDPARRDSNAPFQVKWENVVFMCDPVTANQTIGTGSVEGGIGTKVGKNTFFFYYEDHNIRPDDKIFQDAVRSFKAK